MREPDPQLNYPDRVQWDGRTRGHMEYWVITLNQLNTAASFRIRYSLLVPLKGKVALHVSFSSRVPGRTNSTIAVTVDYPPDQLSWTEDPFWLEMGPCTIESGRMTGMIDDSGMPVTWDLLFSQVTDPLRNLPEYFYRPGVSRFRLLTPLPFMLIGGKIQIGDHQFLLNGDPGQMTHFWGERMPEQWIWFHCSSFTTEEGDPLPAYVSGFGTRERFLGWLPFPPRNYGHMVWSENHVRISPATSWGDRVSGKWIWKGMCNREQVTVEIVAAPAEMSLDEYPEPEGGTSLVHHLEQADCSICFQGPTQQVRTFRSNRMAHLGIGSRSSRRNI